MRVVAAMSGGVDSSVAAARLVEQGHEVIGATMRLLPMNGAGFGCCGSPRDLSDAAAVCGVLGIPHYVLDMAAVFDRTVIAPFVDAYRAGRTPNPCVECNRSVKFGYLLRLAVAWGADAVATGHYARIVDGKLYEAKDTAKDQSYFLYALGPRDLGQILFPIGDLSKTEVRARARALGLPTAEKAESQEICFVGGGDYRGFIAARGGPDPGQGGPDPGQGGPDPGCGGPGDVFDTAGRKVGRHSGLAGYTVGQRKKLGCLKRPGGARARALYVVKLDAGSNTVVVGSEAEARSGGLVAAGLSWTGGIPVAPCRARVRVRHRHPPAEARLEPAGEGRVRVLFEEPQRAVAPGQAAVFYRDGEVLGGGTIEEALP